MARTDIDPPSTASEPELDRLRVVLLRLARRIRHSSTGDITPSQRTVLVSLVNHGPLTIGQIADREHVRPPSASKIVSALESHGLVERRRDPTDRRCTPIAATAAGTDVVEGARAAGRTWLATRLDALEPADRDELDRLVPVLERLLGQAE